MLTSSEIRRQFIRYFQERHQHAEVASSPVVPHDDPTLLFTNAGMNQFKDVFLGTGEREYTRAVDTQKCIRAGGKHNDLEDVGRDTYHHTFFEMLGNWSFGDYFKKEAIVWAWDLLTNVWGIEKDRLHATVFAGDPQEGLDADKEAAELWANLTDIDPTHIHYGSKKDNFWEMGDTGPCGPCSELHVDLTPDKSGASLVNGDDPRVIEIWNLVFIQFNRNASGSLSPLPNKHVDTGMGFERICAVLQGKSSNYDTDVFTPIFKSISEVTGAKPYGSKMDDPVDVAYRVIADHIRCLTFALTDGAVPSNEGRGYVLRRILRRAFRHGRQTLDQHEPFLYKLVPAVAAHMGDAFPELRKDPQRVVDLIKEEEESFARTIDRGIALFDEAAQRGGDRILAEDAFKLYDTYGFPLDLTQVMARERKLAVDVTGFNKLMEEARDRSRAGAGGGDARQALVEIVQQHDLPDTEFLGYDATVVDETTSVRAFAHEENNGYTPVNQLSSDMHGAIVLGHTPFYAEAGGQVGDQGTIEFPDGSFKVEDTIKFGSVYFHLGYVTKGTIAGGDSVAVSLKVDDNRRQRIMANHTSTHVLNRALRKLVNPEADQKGSLVDDEKLRFDFSHNASVTREQIEQIEQQVNADIASDLPVYAEVAAQEDAMKIRGLRAVFGEKYPPRVRVVSIGAPVADLLANPDSDEWSELSIEFCGGTHLPKTGDAEGFVVISEEAVAKGVRRITALTGSAAHKAQARADALLNRIAVLLEADGSDERGLRDEIAEMSHAIGETALPAVARAKIQDGIAQLQQVLRDIEKERSKQATANIVEQARELAEQVAGDTIVARLDADADALRTAMDVLRKKHPEAAMLLAGAADGKVAVVASVPKDRISQGLKAGDWVREVAKVVGGGGGGRPDMAQAGGKDPGKIEQALDTARQFAADKQ